jgi:hypothetical protein
VAQRSSGVGDEYHDGPGCQTNCVLPADSEGKQGVVIRAQAWRDRRNTAIVSK